MNVLQAVAERLVRFRMTAGLELDGAAARAALDPSRLAEAEAGEAALTDAEIERVAAAYGVDPTEIFGGRITPVRDYAGGA